MTGPESFWAAHLGRGLWNWNAGTWKDHSDGSPSTYLNALALYGEGVLAGSQDRGLLLFDGTAWPQLPGTGSGPANVSALASEPGGRRVAVGSYGEGPWLWDGGKFERLSGREFVSAVDWAGAEPWWATVDSGLLWGVVPPLQRLSVADGVASGITSVVSLAGRVWWGTTGNSLGFWSEYDDPQVYR